MVLYRRSGLKLVKNILTDENFLFSEHTTYGLGGHAKVAQKFSNSLTAILKNH